MKNRFPTGSPQVPPNCWSVNHPSHATIGQSWSVLQAIQPQPHASFGRTIGPRQHEHRVNSGAPQPFGRYHSTSQVGLLGGVRCFSHRHVRLLPQSPIRQLTRGRWNPFLQKRVGTATKVKATPVCLWFLSARSDQVTKSTHPTPFPHALQRNLASSAFRLLAISCKSETNHLSRGEGPTKGRHLQGSQTECKVNTPRFCF